MEACLAFPLGNVRLCLFEPDASLTRRCSSGKPACPYELRLISNPADHYMHGLCNRLEKAAHSYAKIQGLTGFDMIHFTFVNAIIRVALAHFACCSLPCGKIRQISPLISILIPLPHTFDAGICWVGGQRNIGLFEPVAECFGMNAEQTSAVCDRKSSHDRVSFREETKRQIGETTVAGIFPELRHFQEISWKSGRKNDGQQISVENGEEARN
jgi:hypothetical protein